MCVQTPAFKQLLKHCLYHLAISETSKIPLQKSTFRFGAEPKGCRAWIKAAK